MKFWDASAIIPLLNPERLTQVSLEILKSDPQMMVWALTPVECYSALYRKEREQKLKMRDIQEFRSRLEQFERIWTEVCDMDLVRRRAARLLASHPLRAADALQLAAALVGLDRFPSAAQFVSFDKNLSKAALKEGLTIDVEWAGEDGKDL